MLVTDLSFPYPRSSNPIFVRSKSIHHWSGNGWASVECVVARRYTEQAPISPLQSPPITTISRWSEAPMTHLFSHYFPLSLMTSSTLVKQETKLRKSHWVTFFSVLVMAKDNSIAIIFCFERHNSNNLNREICNEY